MNEAIHFYIIHKFMYKYIICICLYSYNIVHTGYWHRRIIYKFKPTPLFRLIAYTIENIYRDTHKHKHTEAVVHHWKFGWNEWDAKKTIYPPAIQYIDENIYDDFLFLSWIINKYLRRSVSTFGLFVFFFAFSLLF